MQLQLSQDELEALHGALIDYSRILESHITDAVNFHSGKYEIMVIQGDHIKQIIKKIGRFVLCK